MLSLIRNAELYAPEYVGRQQVLVADNKIAAIAPHIDLPAAPYLSEIDAKGMILAPGFVDPLVHFLGGGGEGGFANRTPELNFAEAAASGVTTLVGALGTDSVTRSPIQLLGKARELTAQGLSAYCYTGSYHLPLKTITGSVEQDIVLLPEVLGIGEVAIADHRASQVSYQALIEVAAEARVAGLLAGKKGVSFFHVGDGKAMLQALRDIVSNSDLPISQLYPTHCNRNSALFVDALDFLALGGAIDFTTSTIAQFIEQGEVPAALALKQIVDKELDWQRVSFSSDANASLPVFSAKGEVQGVQCGSIASLYQSARSAVLEYQVPLAIALAVITHNPASILGLAHKGRLVVGNDADMVLIEPKDLQLQQVFSQGKSIWSV